MTNSSHRDSSCRPKVHRRRKIYHYTYKHQLSTVGCIFVEPCWSVGGIDVTVDIVVCVSVVGIVACKVVEFVVFCCVVIDAIEIIE